MSDEYVILVDEQDNELGTMEKMEAHRQPVLHRAVSVFLFNSNKQLLLQKRADDKYHSGGLWTNTCCSHPRVNESAIDAATRRLYEEMGIECALQPLTKITYSANVGHDMSEYELDHIFVGVSDDVPFLNSSEAAAYRYMNTREIQEWIKLSPSDFTEWFKILFEPVKKELEWKKYL